MNPELSPEDIGLSEQDLEMVGEKTEKEKEPFLEKFLRDGKYVVPASILLTLLSGIKSEAADSASERIRLMNLREGYEITFSVDAARKFAPQYITNKANGSKEISSEVLSRPVGDYIINGKNISLEKNWGTELEKNKSSFEQELDAMAKTRPTLAQKIKESFKSLYGKMFPKGLDHSSNIDVKRLNQDGNLESIDIPASYASINELSEFMTDKTEPIFSELSKLPNDQRVSMTKMIEKEELEILEGAVNQECQKHLITN